MIGILNPLTITKFHAVDLKLVIFKLIIVINKFPLSQFYTLV
jgi:hypothetical protein